MLYINCFFNYSKTNLYKWNNNKNKMLINNNNYNNNIELTKKK